MNRVAEQWAEELAGYTHEELMTGYRALKGRQYPPSLQVFQELCRPPIPPIEAYYAAIAGLQARQRGEVGEWSHPAIFYAAAGMASDLLESNYARIKDRWEAALKMQLAKGAWEPIEKPTLALGYTPTPTDAKQAKERLSQIGAASVLAARSEHTTWYRRILERAKRGDMSISQHQLQAAQAAAKQHGYVQQ